ncbi:MAG: AMP-binding protein, partial [Micromonosporaceae bacterium]
MAYPSPYPSVEIPDVSVPEYLFGDLSPATAGGNAAAAEHPALIDGTSGQTISYGQLAQMVDRVAAALAERGIGKGDVVGIFVPNVPLWPAVFHGVLASGATATTVNSLLTADEVAKQLKDAGAKLLFTVSPFLDRADPAATAAGIDPATGVIPLDGAEGRGDLKQLLACQGPTPRPTVSPAEDLAVLPYSSGTTGQGKGVMLTHRNLVANLAQCEDPLRPDTTERVLAVLPFFHIYGMQVVLNLFLRHRKTVVTLPKFELPTFLQAIQDHRTDTVFIAPPVALALAKHPLVDQFDLSAMRYILSGAAPLDEELAAAVSRRLNVRMRQGYGMTETSPVTHAIPMDDRGESISVGTVGPPLPDTECRVVDPATGEAASRGELWMRGPQVMKGYLNNPQATADTIDSDGWIHTGDVVEVDDAGLFTVVDRVKELIKYKGYQVPPAELEALLLTHPKIADAAVIGIRDPDGEEVPKAYVVVHD